MGWKEELKKQVEEILAYKEVEIQKLLDLMFEVERIVPGFSFGSIHRPGEPPLFIVGWSAPPYDEGYFQITPEEISQWILDRHTIDGPEYERLGWVNPEMLADSMVAKIDDYLLYQLEQYRAAQKTIRLFCQKKVGWPELRKFSA